MGVDRDRPVARKKSISPSAWLIVPTLALLLGQAVAAGPWHLTPAAATLSILPLSLFASPRWRAWGILLALSAAAFSVGYLRHRQLLFPQFGEDHLLSATAREERVYLEGTLRHEPEKLVNRTRWQVAAQRIWHPTGAEEISGDILVTLRHSRRDWRYGDRVRFRIRPVLPRNSGSTSPQIHSGG